MGQRFIAIIVTAVSRTRRVLLTPVCTCHKVAVGRPQGIKTCSGSGSARQMGTTLSVYMEARNKMLNIIKLINIVIKFLK